MPLVPVLTPGDRRDVTTARRTCIGGVTASAELVADMGHDSNDLRAWPAPRGTGAVIPPNGTADALDFDADSQRYVIKRRSAVSRSHGHRSQAKRRPASR